MKLLTTLVAAAFCGLLAPAGLFLADAMAPATRSPCHPSVWPNFTPRCLGQSARSAAVIDAGQPPASRPTSVPLPDTSVTEEISPGLTADAGAAAHNRKKLVIVWRSGRAMPYAVDD